MRIALSAADVAVQSRGGAGGGARGEEVARVGEDEGPGWRRGAAGGGEVLRYGARVGGRLGGGGGGAGGADVVVGGVERGGRVVVGRSNGGSVGFEQTADVQEGGVGPFDRARLDLVRVGGLVDGFVEGVGGGATPVLVRAPLRMA